MTLPLKAHLEKLLAEVKANHAKLESCIGPHEFELVDSPGHKPTLNPTEVCRLCGGSVPGRHADWYRLGLKHSKGEP